nr:uncharacterized protein LOC127347229 [Lolium perenne]
MRRHLAALLAPPRRHLAALLAPPRRPPAPTRRHLAALPAPPRRALLATPASPPRLPAPPSSRALASDPRPGPDAQLPAGHLCPSRRRRAGAPRGGLPPPGRLLLRSPAGPRRAELPPRCPAQGPSAGSPAQGSHTHCCVLLVRC